MKKDGSNLTIKEEFLYGNNNMSERPMSAANRRPHSCMSKKLPSVTNTTVDIQSTINPKPFGHIIEKEKLFEETLQLKLVIQRLRKELTLINNENKMKDYQLTVKDYEIKGIIEESETPDYCPTVQDTSLISKVRNQYKILQKEYEEEVEQGELLKHQYKLTKMNELNIENEIFKIQIEKINALYQNSYQTNEINSLQLSEYSNVVNNIKNQTIILDSFKENLIELMSKEQSLNLELEELKAKCKKYAEVINKTNEENEMLYKQNDTLANANQNNNTANSNKRLISSYSIKETKEAYVNRISDLENQIKYYKSQNKRYAKQLSQMNTAKSSLAKKKQLNKEDIVIDYKVIQNSKAKANNDTMTSEDQVKQLKVTLEASKIKEQTLEKLHGVYQEKVRALISSSNIMNDQPGFGLSKDNPFYTENDDNNPLDTKKMTTIQYNQFTYILFKNFEARKVNKYIANEKIIKPTIKGDINDITLEVIVARMSNAIMTLLNCNNIQDKERLELYLTGLFYNFDGDINKIVDSFLILFAYIEDYSNDKEDKIKAKLASKHKEKYDQLKDNILLTNDKYISLLKVKEIIDEKNIEIKDKYIEYIFYKMKQFDDDKASLFDLDPKKLEDLFDFSTSHINENENDNENGNGNGNGNENENESIQEITTEEYEKIIKESLRKISKALKERKMVFRDLVKECIVNDSQGKSKGVVSIEDLNDALKKISVTLEDLYLSCLCTKYCEEDGEQRLLSVDTIEKDLNIMIMDQYHNAINTDNDKDKSKQSKNLEEDRDEDEDVDDENENEYEFEDKEEIINKTH